MPSFLCAFMLSLMRVTQDVGEERQVTWHEDVALDSDQIIDDAPGVFSRCSSEEVAILARRESKMLNVGGDSMATSGSSMAPWWDRASATMLVELGRYSTWKSKPINLLAH
jgi:hypothetical protein